MKCTAYIPTGKGGWNKGHSLTAAQRAKARIRHAEFMVWQAEFVGWPALADSFRRDLRALQQGAAS